MQFLLIFFVVAVFVADLFVPAAVIFCLSLSSDRAQTLGPWSRGWAGGVCGFAIYSAAAFALASAFAIGFHYFGHHAFTRRQTEYSGAHRSDAGVVASRASQRGGVAQVRGELPRDST